MLKICPLYTTLIWFFFFFVILCISQMLTGISKGEQIFDLGQSLEPSITGISWIPFKYLYTSTNFLELAQPHWNFTSALDKLYCC
jgi:hypothetical protein